MRFLGSICEKGLNSYSQGAYCKDTKGRNTDAVSTCMDKVSSLPPYNSFCTGIVGPIDQGGKANIPWIWGLTTRLLAVFPLPLLPFQRIKQNATETYPLILEEDRYRGRHHAAIARYYIAMHGSLTAFELSLIHI